MTTNADQGGVFPSHPGASKAVTVASGTPTNGQLAVFNGDGNEVVPATDGALHVSSAADQITSPAFSYPADGSEQQVPLAPADPTASWWDDDASAITEAGIYSIYMVLSTDVAATVPGLLASVSLNGLDATYVLETLISTAVAGPPFALGADDLPTALSVGLSLPTDVTAVLVGSVTVQRLVF